MLAENNPIIDEAASTIYSISQDDILLEQIRARDEAIAHENYLRKQLEQKDKQLEEHIRARDEAIAHKNYVRKQMEQKNKQLDQQSKQLNILSKQRDKDALLIESLRTEIEELRRNQK